MPCVSSYPGLLRVDGDESCITPQAFQLIEVAQRGVEDVHDELDVIEKNPAALGESFDVVRPYTFLLELIQHVLGDGAHVRVGGAAGDQKVVSGIRDAIQVECYDVVGLEIQTQSGCTLHLREGGRHGLEVPLVCGGNARSAWTV